MTSELRFAFHGCHPDPATREKDLLADDAAALPGQEAAATLTFRRSASTKETGRGIICFHALGGWSAGFC